MYCTACGARLAENTQACAQCGQPAPTTGKDLVPPPPPSSGVWAYRQGNKVVLPKGAELPPNCIQCGQPATKWVPQTYLLGALVLGRWKLAIPFCDRHWKARRGFRIVAGLFFLAVVPGGWLVEKMNLETEGMGFVAGVFILIGATLFSACLRHITPSRVDGGRATLLGASEAFLQRLPPPPDAVPGK